MSHRKTIIIADDHPLMAEGLSAMIHRYTKYKVLATVNNGKALLHALNAHKPDLVVLDINMPELNGIDAAAKIKQKFPVIKVILISMYWELTVANAVKKLSIDGFIPKLAEGTVFVETLIKIMSGEKVFIGNQNGKEKARMDKNYVKMKLTERELEVIQLIKKGFTSKEISTQLHLSVYTIHTHRKNICRKLKISSPNALVKFVHENTF